MASFSNLSGVSSSFNMSQYQKTGIFLNILFLLILGAASYIFVENDLDRKISSFFYATGSGWEFSDRQPWTWLHKYGNIPGVLFSLLALILFIVSPFRPELSRIKRHLLVIILTAGIGGGVIVNIILKDNWGRPRPHQIKEFGGYWEYRGLNEPGIPGKGRSFTCGHCTMGYIFATTLFFYKTSKTLAIAGGVTGLIFGALMSLSRIGQGGHFATDTLWSLAIILITANTLNTLLLPSMTENEKRVRIRCKNVAISGFSVIGVAVLISLLLGPIYSEYKEEFPVEAQTRTLYLKFNFQNYDLKLHRSDKGNPSISAHVSGRGSPSAKVAHRIVQTSKGKTTCLDYSLEKTGYIASSNLSITVSLPSLIEARVVKTDNCG